MSLDLLAQANFGKPMACFDEVRIIGIAMGGRCDFVGARIGTEEADISTDPPQSHQCLADPFVLDMTFGIDDEVIVAKARTCRARLNEGEVDATD